MSTDKMLILLLVVLLPLSGCTGKPLGAESSDSYCIGYQNPEETSVFYDEPNCEGWRNDIALEPGEHHVIDHQQYDTNVSLYFESFSIPEENGTDERGNINLYSLSETNYNDYVACESFLFIEEFSWQNTSANHPYVASGAGFGDSTIPTMTTFDSFGEDVFIVIDNWHCEDQPDDVETLIVNVHYRIGIMVEPGTPPVSD